MAETVPEEPEQITSSVIVKVGVSFTVTITSAEILGQPFKVYATEYVDVKEGETEIEDVVSPPGDHKNVPPPVAGVAVNVVISPSQIEFTPARVTVDPTPTVTVLIALLTHPK